MKLYQLMFKSDEYYTDDGCSYSWPSSCVFKTKKEAKQYAEDQGYNKGDYYIHILDLVEKLKEVEKDTDYCLYKQPGITVYRGRTYIYGED